MCIRELIFQVMKACKVMSQNFVCSTKAFKMCHFHNVTCISSICVYCWNLKADFGLLRNAIELLDGIIHVQLFMFVTPAVIRRPLEPAETRWSNRCRAGIHRRSSIIYPAFHFSSICCSLQCAECFIVMARPLPFILGFHGAGLIR